MIIYKNEKCDLLIPTVVIRFNFKILNKIFTPKQCLLWFSNAQFELSPVLSLSRARAHLDETRAHTVALRDLS